MKTIKLDQLSKEQKELFDKASAVRKNAYAPYSGHHVGASLRTSDGKVFSGCNVENSSYGASNCAERTAVQTAVSTGGKFKLQSVCVVTDANPPWSPCGICRQVLAEFADDAPILILSATGEGFETTLKELLPHSFNPKNLLASSS